MEVVRVAQLEELGSQEQVVRGRRYSLVGVGLPSNESLHKLSYRLKSIKRRIPTRIISSATSISKSLPMTRLDSNPMSPTRLSFDQI